MIKINARRRHTPSRKRHKREYGEVDSQGGEWTFIGSILTGMRNAQSAASRAPHTSPDSPRRAAQGRSWAKMSAGGRSRSLQADLTNGGRRSVGLVTTPRAGYAVSFLSDPEPFESDLVALRAASRCRRASSVTVRRLRMPKASRITAASWGAGRRSRYRQPWSSPSCVTRQISARRALTLVHLRADRSRSWSAPRHKADIRHRPGRRDRACRRLPNCLHGLRREPDRAVASFRRRRERQVTP